MEHIIFSQVMKHLNDNNIIVHYHHGFRSDHSCKTQLLTTIEDISRTLDMRKQVDMMILEQVQRRAARFVHNNYTERTPGCVTHMVQNLGWQPLQQRRYNNRLIIMFKIIYALVDVQTDVIRIGDSRTRGSNQWHKRMFICSPFSLAPSGNGTFCQP
jgi:hypothetical protein